MKRRKPHPLRVAQHRGHIALDNAYAPLAHAAEQIVLRHSIEDERGRRRLSAFGKVLAMHEIEQLIRNAEPGIAVAIAAATAEADRVGAEGG